jgi:hypothetical protein
LIFGNYSAYFLPQSGSVVLAFIFAQPVSHAGIKQVLEKRQPVKQAE